MKKQLLIVLMFLPFSIAFSQNLQISGGNNFSAAVCDNQQVFVWGANASKQLGIIDNTGTPEPNSYVNLPQSVLYGNVSNTAGGLSYGNLPAIRQIDAGSGAHLLGLSCASQVWAWGDNTKGQLGRNSTGNSAVPQRVLRGQQAAAVGNPDDPNGVFLNNIFYVSGGNNSSYALESGTGKVLAWGQNANGQLGNGNTTDQLTPVYVLKAAGVPLTNIVQIEGGDDCTYALDASGNVWSWGNNSGNKLGRPGASPQSYAGQVVKGDPLNSGYSATPTPTQYLGNIVQISGGDTHCLALDSAGNVWSFGSDWGQGQLGRGGGSVYQDDARRVVRPGLAAYATAEADFLGNGTDGKAVYVSAGQASSAVVLANGKVVTFGARGLYNNGPTAVPVGEPAIDDCPAPGVDGDMIVSGTLGDNTTDCGSTSCSGKTSSWSVTPVYVIDNSTGTALTGIASVSDGDAWYYAVSTTGTAYAWGWNRRGELGLGDYTDRCRAVSFTLPSGCAFSDPCPGAANLGDDVTTCPVFSTILNSNVPATYPSYEYTWEYRAETSDPWTSLGAAYTNGTNATYPSANGLGQYRVVITDNRGTVPFLCAPCPVQGDTITFTETPNPYTTTGCKDESASLAQFEIVSPATAKIKWYTDATGGSPLNPVGDSSTTWTTDYANTNTSITGCDRALFAEDVSSFAGTLRPGTTVASAPCGGAGSAEGGSRSPIKIEVTQNLTLTGLSFIIPNQGYAQSSTYSIRVFSNDPTIGWNCGGCSPANSKSGAPGTLLHTSAGTLINTPASSGDVVRTLTTSFAMTGTTASPTTYWIDVNGGDVKYFNCSPAATTSGVPVPVWTSPENSSPAGMKAVLALHDNSVTGNSHLFNITFNVGTAYTCGRILVCASGSCTLPVKLTNFDVTSVGSTANLNWSTGGEVNSSHFIIQKSSDGINFTNIGTISAAGNSNADLSYSFNDPNLDIGTTYYRLEQHDIDGKVYYSEIKSTGRDGIYGVKVIPNPNNGSFEVILQGFGERSAKLILLNSLSQEVFTTNNAGTSNGINIQHLPAGVYYLQVLTDNGIIVEKIVKE